MKKMGAEAAGQGDLISFCHVLILSSPQTLKDNVIPIVCIRIFSMHSVILCIKRRYIVQWHR